jgi:iron(III) transport system ATP-binding protein
VTVPFLRLAGVSKRYGGRGGIEDVSLDVSTGESVVVLGPSGSGKTTLLRLIAGLERPDAGEIWLDGRQVAQRGRNRVPAHERKVGFLFQDLALWPHLSVRGNVEFAASSAGGRESQKAAQIDDILRMCKVEASMVDRYPHQLSGGEQQRVAIARALVGSPRLLLLDEPFSGLDPDLRAALQAELASLRRRLGLTAIYVTHDRSDVETFGDRTITMRNSRLSSGTQSNRAE